jgi:hypothetical protein
MKEFITLDRRDAEEIASFMEDELEEKLLSDEVVPMFERLAMLLRDKLAGRIE